MNRLRPTLRRAPRRCMTAAAAAFAAAAIGYAAQRTPVVARAADLTPHKSEPLDDAADPVVPVVRQIEGWTVHIHPKLLEGAHRDEGERTLQMLANHLQRIAILVPASRLSKLQQAEFWIEHAHPTLGTMQYHPSRQWLVEHGHDPRLAKKVHITHAAELLSRQQMLKHPAVILHELAHAYHDQVLGFDDPRIKDAYERAHAAGHYEKVLLYDGRRVRHYAMTDHKEYFAEATEAYFYRNDFFPFVAAELKEHDPRLYDLLVEIWGPVE